MKPLGITPSPESSHQLTFASEPSPSQFHEWRIDPFPPDHPELWHALVYFPHAGIYEIALALEHEDANAPAFQRFTVVVGNDGAVQISDTETN